MYSAPIRNKIKGFCERDLDIYYAGIYKKIKMRISNLEAQLKELKEKKQIVIAAGRRHSLFVLINVYSSFSYFESLFFLFFLRVFVFVSSSSSSFSFKSNFDDFRAKVTRLE